jgi:hypothetical protein
MMLEIQFLKNELLEWSSPNYFFRWEIESYGSCVVTDTGYRISCLTHVYVQYIHVFSDMYIFKEYVYMVYVSFSWLR